MYEIHGWAVVSTSILEEDDDEKDAKAMAAVRHRVALFSDGNPQMRLFYLNGKARVTVYAFTNHDGPAIHEVFEFYEWLGNTAPGSYGLLFARDESRLHDNEFVVYAMRRGKVTTHSDPFLSPCIPLIDE